MSAVFQREPSWPAPGTRARVNVPVPTDPGEEPVSISVLVVHGSEPGPVLNLSAGQHGDEYMAGMALNRLYELVDPAALRGTLLLTPCINPAAFAAGTRLTPQDGKDLNRVWPGRADGTLTERIAHAYWTEVVSLSHYLLDFHDGGAWLNMEPLCGVDRVADQGLYEKAVHLAAQTGLPVLWQDDPWPASLPTEAFGLGVVGLTVEYGAELERPEAVVADHVRLGLSTLRGLGMLPGTADAGGATEPVRGKFGTSTHSGLFRPSRERGGRTEEGELLGLITDATGTVLEEVRASASGRLLFLRRTSVIKAGERTFLIGVPTSEVKS